MKSLPALAAPPVARARWAEWLDEQSGRVFIAPAVFVIVAFSVFPLGLSALLALSRFSLEPGGYELKFVGVLNLRKLLTGSQQYHFLGTQGETSLAGWLLLAGATGLLAWMFRRRLRHMPLRRRWAVVSIATFTCILSAAVLAPLGPFAHFAGTIIERAEQPWFVWVGGVGLFGLAVAALLSRASGTSLSAAGWGGRLLAGWLFMVMIQIVIGTLEGQQGSLLTTVFYVLGGIALQFALGLGLAVLCAQNIRGRNFFRLSFFLPLMVTPVGVAYTFRMLADMSVGPFAPIGQIFGVGALTWAQDAWSARWVVLFSDTWQWTPFTFIVMLAAIEGQSREQVEAAELDGASSWRVFRDITWPGIAPTAAAVVLIRLIEGFKIVDLPNVLTNGGPGIATESLTLHAFMDWRTLNLGGSAAVAYMLLFVATVSAVSFFRFVVRPAREARR